MRLIGKKILLKLKKKNIGNLRLCNEIDKLIKDLEKFPPNEKNIFNIKPDADNVHRNAYYFFDLDFHRTLILVELDDDGEAYIQFYVPKSPTL